MSRAVAKSEDFERIRNLPVRHVTAERAARDNAAFTELLRTPLGKVQGEKLIGLQGFVLRELCESTRPGKPGGSYTGIPVGGGKTLVSFLAPVVTEAKRPLLVIPASLRTKTITEYAKYARHWQAPNPAATIATYTEFTDDSAIDLFERLQPDFVMFDEADKLSNQEGSCTKRFARWKAKSGCGCWAATGTGTRFSIAQFSHLLTWSLEESSPVPINLDECESWASALDERPAKFFGPARRTRVGVLVDLAKGIEDAKIEGAATELALARLAFQTRLRSTSGVVIIDDDSCQQKLNIHMAAAPEDPTINEHFRDFRTDEVTPDGETLVDSLEIFSKEQQLGAGLNLVWDPRPPDVWLAARRNFARFVRGKILATASSPAPLDTPEAVAKRYKDHPIVRAWKAIKPTFKPNSVPVWLSGSVVDYAAAWAAQGPGLIWSNFNALGVAIATAGRIKYFGAKGLAADGSDIENAPANTACVLSIDANLRGRNLQRFNRNLIIGAPQSARDLEQLLGRTHRYRQERPVSVEILATSGLSLYSWQMAIKEATFVLHTQGQRQKILRADFEGPSWPSDALRWRVKEK